MNISIRELKYIIEIANSGNMTKAATRLFITQPALSRMLKKIENGFGLPLFYREGNVMTPTEAGALFVEYGKKIAHDFDLMEENIHDLKTMKRGKVVFGVPPVISAFDFPEVIMRFKKRYPGITVEFVEHGARELESMVVAGKVDVAISMHPILSDELSELIIVRDEVVCVMNKDHPLAEKEKIELVDLSKYLFNTFPDNFAVYQELINNMKAKGLMPKINVTSPTCDFLLKISHLSNELCVIPAPCVSSLCQNNMVIRPFNPSFNWSLCIVYKKNFYMPDKVKALISCIQQTIDPSV